MAVEMTTGKAIVKRAKYWSPMKVPQASVAIRWAMEAAKSVTDDKAKAWQCAWWLVDRLAYRGAVSIARDVGTDTDAVKSACAIWESYLKVDEPDTARITVDALAEFKRLSGIDPAWASLDDLPEMMTPKDSPKLPALDPSQRSVLPPEWVIHAVLQAAGMAASDRWMLGSRSRAPLLVQVRRLCVGLLREHTILSFPDIADQFGCTNHSTVVTQHKRYKQLLVEDSDEGRDMRALLGQARVNIARIKGGSHAADD